MLAEASYYLRMAAGLAQYRFQPPMTDPAGELHRQLLHREAHFLAMARRAWSTAGHIWRRMFDLAGCTIQDLDQSVHDKGLRPTLSALYEAGVYVTSDELRGRSPVVRQGRELPSTAADWINPHGRGLFESSSSGSSGGIRLMTQSSPASFRYRETYDGIAIKDNGLRLRTPMLLASILPSAWPLRLTITYARLGVPFRRWFAYPASGPLARHYRLASSWLVRQSRLLAASVPLPEFLPENDFMPVVHALEDARRRSRPAFLRVSPSSGARIASLAVQTGRDISGSLFAVGGEPLTGQKHQAMQVAGVKVISHYNATEVGTIGYGCLSMHHGNCVHVFEDSLFPLSANHPGQDSSPLLLTTLHPLSPRFLINLEIGDTAVLEPATCDCAFSRAGLRLAARDIFSLGKVTGQGMTLHSADLIRILEEVLPSRFGGSLGDYQLAEIEGPSQTRMVLRVCPTVGALDESALRQAFLAEIRKLQGGHLSARVWSFSHGIEILRESPARTLSGKLPAVRLLASGPSPRSAQDEVRQ